MLHTKRLVGQTLQLILSGTGNTSVIAQYPQHMLTIKLIGMERTGSLSHKR